MTRQYLLDASWERFGTMVLAGSPLVAFRTTDAGARVLDALERDEAVANSGLIDRLVAAGAIHPNPSAHASSTTSYSIADVTIVTPQFGGSTTTDDRITVDDGSVPPIAGATVRLEQNLGPAAARNAARPLVDTALIAFVDADVELLDDVGIGSWLDALLPHFDDPRVGLVAPRVTGEANSPLDLGTSPARIRAGTRVSYVPAAAIVVRVAAFDAVGGFDEGLRFGEDVDLVWRLDQADWRCRYEPTSTVWHAPRRTLSARLQQHAGYGTAAAALALRHPDLLAPTRTSGWTAAMWGALVTGHPLIAAGLAVITAARLPSKLPGVAPARAFTLAITGHVRAGQQFAAAARRVWWPIVAVGALFSLRVRWAGLAALAISPATAPTDAAYGWGVWSGAVRHRTAAPLLPGWTRYRRGS